MNQPTADPSTQGTMPYALHQVLDTHHQGVVAAAFEYPAGWHVQSGLSWNFQNVSFPVTMAARVSDAAGSAVFEFLPLESFCWLQPDYGLYPQGTNLLGQVLLPPMPAGDAMTRWIIPRHRGDRPGLTVMEVRPMPLLAKALAMDLGTVAGEGIGVIVRYIENGHAVQEEFYGINAAQSVPYTGPQGLTMQINWGFVRLFSYRSEPEQLDPLRPVFWRIARSVKVNPQWQQLFNQVMQQLQQQFDQFIQAGYSQIQAAGELSRAISANNDALLAGFEQQRLAARRSSASSDGSSRSPNEGFSEYIRGVETMDDPHWGESQQDYTYKYHWTDGFGNYQHSNDSFFNPNMGSSQDWTLMEPKRG
jgi:hypothetical protein